jgi:multidrug efflux system membrane fusion protein
MRAVFSYGFAFVILLLAGAWFATGTLVQGGQGPGNGEKAIVSLIEGEDHGPIAGALGNAGLLAEHHAPEVDPNLTIAQRNEATTGAAAPLQSVRTQTFTAGSVDVVHVTKGQRVAVGDLLCTLDQGTRAAAVAQAKAALAQAQLSFDTNIDLRDRGLAPPNSANAVEVALAQAQAGLDNAQAELDRTEIKAKVAGLVQDPLATAGTMLNPGSPCATIVQLNPIVFTGMVPEAHIGLARTGLNARIKTMTGQSVDGKVTYISSVADNATRAFRAEIEIANDDYAIRDGVTAEAIVNIGTAPGHLLPQSVLTLDDDGILGVRTVENSVVAFYPITIVSDTREGIWVTGLPISADVITIGQENVTAGQHVEASPTTATTEPTAS